MTETQIKSLADYCVRTRTHYSELQRPVRRFYKQQGKELPSADAKQVVAAVRQRLHAQHPSGGWL